MNLKLTVLLRGIKVIINNKLENISNHFFKTE